MKDWKIEIAKALIAATIPTVLKILLEKKPESEEKPIDWDREYEKLLSEEDRKRKKKKFPKMKKAHE